jgi:competence protein CoiA
MRNSCSSGIFLFVFLKGFHGQKAKSMYISFKGGFSLLTAIMNQGERICLGDEWDKQKLLFLREKVSFSCPYCKKMVILKLGDKRIFHFSHVKGTLCEFDHKGESEYHLRGKLQLYQWLKDQNLSPILEYFDTKIRQRADIIFFIGKKSYALEYQCSNIDEATLLKRTKRYISNGYHPIWILGANQLNRKSTHITSFTNFQYLFLQKTAPQFWMIPFYCSQTKKFILHHSLQPITIRNTFSSQKIINTGEMGISQLLLTSDTVPLPLQKDHWMKELNLWKNKMIRYPGSRRNPFLIELYQNSLNLLLLPPFLGLPVRNNLCILTPPLIWQTYLFIDVFKRRELNTPIRFHDIFMAFKRRHLQKHIQLRQLPLIEDGDATIAVHQYLQTLVHTNIIKKFNEHTYQINEKLAIPKSIEEQKKMEEAFYKRFDQTF